MKSILVLALTVVASIAVADTAQVRKDEKDCLAKAQNNGDMQNCANEAQVGAGVLLDSTKVDINNYLNANKTTETKEIAARYTKSQRAWEAFREADCKLEGVAMLGGSGENLLVMGCKTEQTLKRVDQLVELQKVW